MLDLDLSLNAGAALMPLGGGVSAPANTALPAISGTPTQGQTLTVSNGTWSNSPTSYAYQWKANGSNIGGATASTYLLTVSEVGSTITCTVIATNAGGSASATSAATSAVAVATFVSDDFAGGSTVALAGWVPDVGNNWVMNSAGASTGQVDGVNTRATASVASAHYGINPTSPASTDYEVSGGVKNITGDNLPGLLLGWSDTVLTGYRVYYQTASTAGIYFQRLTTGTALALQTIPVVGDFTTTTHNWRFARFVMGDRVRLRVIDSTTGQVATYDDKTGGRLSAIGYGGIGMRLNSSVVAPFTVKSLPPPSAPTAINSDGARTWYNNPVVLVDGAYMFAGSVKSDGSIQVTKTDGTTNSTTVLSSALQIDDHDEATMLKLSNSKLACFYSKHSADSTLRYRVASNALPDISAFAVEKTITDVAGAVAYTLPHRFSDGYIRVFYRQGNSTDRPRKMAKTLESDLIAGTETWALSIIFQTTNERPYMVDTQSGDTVHFGMTNGHPQEVATSLYHCYMTVAAGVESFFKSDGTSLSTPIDVAASATLVDNTTGGRVWNDKIAIGPDGKPRMLFTKYPTGTTTSNAMYQDVEYWHARWTGSAWTKTRLLTGQTSLYPAQPYYVGGMCFDGNDVTKVYAAKIINGIYELVLLSIDEAGGTVSQVSQLTSNSQCHNIRPQSPAGASRPYAVTWLHGRYATYNDFEMEMRAA